MQAGLSGLFPPSVAIRWGPVQPDAGAFWPGERRAAGSMGPERRAEFETGRALARRALADLGQPGTDLPPDQDRVPVWPSGFCGTISHARCSAASLCAAAAGSRRSWLSLGLDVECARRLEPRVARRVVTSSEQRQMTSRGLDPAELAVVVFAAKEAVFKARFPVTRRFLDFPDVRVALDIGAGAFTATVRPETGRGVIAGRFCFGEDFVAAAVAIPAPVGGGNEPRRG